MAMDLNAQSEKQLARIQQTAGRTIDDFAREVRDAGLDKHGAMVAHFKSRYGMGHGDANALAIVVRHAIAGGPPPADDLLAAQYAGGKAALLPVYERLATVAEGMGDDVTKVVQKTGVSFRRRKQFALVQAASAKRVRLGLNLDATPADPRVEVAGGMCTHRVDIASVGEVDTDVEAWIRMAYDRAR